MSTDAQRSPVVPTWRRFVRKPLGVTALIALVAVIMLSVFAALISPVDPNFSDLRATALPPGSPGHLFGTDRSGRDLYSRVLWGGQISLAGAALALAVAAVIGVPTGLIAGYYGKAADAVFTWLNSLLLALPVIVVLLAVRAVAGPSTWTSMAVFGVMLSSSFFVLVRNIVIGVRQELFIDAAKVSGLSDLRVIGRHVLTTVRAPIIIQAAFLGGLAIGVQAALEFLGVGDPRTPSWGGMLNEAFLNIFLTPEQLIWPSVAIGLTSASLVVLANAIRDSLEDRSGGSSRRRSRRAASVSIADAPPVSSAESIGADRHLLVLDQMKVVYDQRDGSSKEVVRDVSLTLDRGEILGLVGESGSGKSQTAFSILGLLTSGGRISSGRIFFAGTELTTLSRRAMAGYRGARIGYIPQEPMNNLDPAYTVGHHLVEPLRVVLKLSKAEATRQALELLARVGIADPERTFTSYPHQISGGMAQRVLIAGAVSFNPELLIADEPTTALDVTVQAEILDLIRDLQTERGMSVLLVTHNFGVVADLCDRVAVMKEGSIVETAAVHSVFDSPTHPYTRELLGSVLEGKPPRVRAPGAKEVTL